MIQLHYSPSSAAMAPHILLEELGLPFEKILVNTSTGAHRLDAYRQLNPNGLVPTLTDGDLVLYESAAICLHLCDTHPGAALAPPLGSSERAHFYKWLMWLTNTLQATLIVYFYPDRWLNAGNTAGVLALQAHAEAKVGLLLDQLDAELERQGAAHTSRGCWARTTARWTSTP